LSDFAFSRAAQRKTAWELLNPQRDLWTQILQVHGWLKSVRSLSSHERFKRCQRIALDIPSDAVGQMKGLRGISRSGFRTADPTENRTSAHH
jgi:hypothetical protein